MTTRPRWSAASEDALSWICQVATFAGVAGYEVGPMPDKIYVLHPFQERVDGKRIHRVLGSTWQSQPDEATARYRAVRWDEFARRHQLPTTAIDAFLTTGYGALNEASEEDTFVLPPDEGSLDDTATQAALFDVLTRHTTGRDSAMCTAYWYDFAVDDDAPPIMRGPLGAWREVFDRDDRRCSPQNIWPDSHQWVVNTDYDSRATAVSGPAGLTAELLRSPALETVRPGDATA